MPSAGFRERENAGYRPNMNVGIVGAREYEIRGRVDDKRSDGLEMRGSCSQLTTGASL